MDEIQWKKGHKYLTLVYQINQGCVRLLWIGLERTEVSFNEFFNSLAERSKEIKFVCSDMWKPYLKVIKEGSKNRSGNSCFGSFSYSGKLIISMVNSFK